MRREIEAYEGPRSPGPLRLQYLETTHDGISGSSILHPIEKIIFRIQSNTEYIGSIPESWLGPYSRFEAAILRRGPEGRWLEVLDSAHVLQDVSSTLR